jgi:hypothetical protein
LSLAARVTVTLPLTQLFDVPEMPVVGAVRSILTAGLLVAVVERPAPFVTVFVLVRPVPSPVIVVSAGGVGMPDSGSAAVQSIVTSPLYQPLPLGGVVGAPDSVGGVVSPAGAVDDAVAVLPALSVAVPVTVTPGWTVFEFVAEPSATQVAMPEPAPPELASSQVNVTVVVPFGFWVCAAVIVGLALSRRTVTEPGEPVLPSRSDCAGAVTVTMPFELTESDLNGCAAVTPEPASVAVQFTVTLLLFQPAPLGAGVSAAETTGPVLSRVYDAWVEFVAPVQLLALKPGDAETVYACAPLPAGAVSVNVQFDFAVLDVWRGIDVAPVTSTHFVSLLVTTVSVTAAPCFAYSVPPTLTVFAPPENTAEETVDAKAFGCISPPKTTPSSSRSQPSSRYARCRRLLSSTRERVRRNADT